ncbi:MAG: ABC transporter permease [Rhizobiaceae bacterium]|nr:ABC transporter permease [Rhizobiaceae bacterium]
MSTAESFPSRIAGNRAFELPADFLRRQPVAAGGLIVILLLIFAAIFAEQLAPYDPFENDYGAMLAAPSAEHWLGTDSYGRDILSRLIYGTRPALVIGFASSFIGCSLGAVIGTVSAYFGGKTDLIIMRFVDIMLTMPVIVTAIVTAAVLGRNRIGAIDLNLVAAIAIAVVPTVTRVVRSAALAIRDLPYVDAARVSGFSNTRIVLRHMLPNVAAPYLIMLTGFIGQAILLGAALTYVGLGVSEPQPDWGLMLSGEAANFYREAPWMILFPGLAVTLAVFAFNLMGDGLRDWLDPKFAD